MPHPFHLAQVNIARLLAPLESEQLRGFVDALAPVNALADAAPGFVWRLQTEDGDATSVRAFPDPDVIVNLSVWESLDALRAFVYRTDHVQVLRQRRKWFAESTEPFLALWHVPSGHVPTVEEAKDRLAFLTRHGPSPWAFTFSRSQAPVVVERAAVGDPEVQRLIGELNAEILRLDPDGRHFFDLAPDHVDGDQGVLLVLRDVSGVVGCGAVRRLSPSEAELKRMYLDPAQRGRFLGAALVDALEAEARAMGVERLLLETGTFLTSAVRAYERAGFIAIPRYGEYVDSPDSYCMGKSLT